MFVVLQCFFLQVRVLDATGPPKSDLWQYQDQVEEQSLWGIDGEKGCEGIGSGSEGVDAVRATAAGAYSED